MTNSAIKYDTASYCKLNIKNKFDLTIYFVFSCAFIFNYIYLIKDSTINDFFVILTFFIIGLISFIGLIKSKKMISVNRMFFLFIFLFFYLAPLHQYFSNVKFWNVNTSYSSEDYLIANILIIIHLLIYILFNKIKIKPRKYKENKQKVNNFALLVYSLVTILCIFLLYKEGKLIEIGSANTDSEDSFTYMVLKILRMFPVLSLVYFIQKSKANQINVSKGIKKIFLFISWLSIAIIFFPLNGTMNRFFLFGTYIILIDNIFSGKKYKSFFLIIAFLGFGIVFPMFNFFKYHTISEISKITIEWINLDFQDYDAYQIFMNSIKYVDSNGLMLGKNIITGIFGLIPRSIWTTKLYPSGSIVAEYFNASFTNVSCPLIAEFYLSNGTFGIIIFTALFSIFIKYIDVNSFNPKIKILNSILIGLCFSLFRGALLPVMTFIYSILIAYFAVIIINKITILRRIK